jgi:hypothetical protein
LDRSIVSANRESLLDRITDGDRIEEGAVGGELPSIVVVPIFLPLSVGLRAIILVSF